MGVTTIMEKVAAPRRGLGIALLARTREYLIASAIFLVVGVAFFNPIFRGFAFSYVGAEQNVTYPWIAHPTPFVGTYPQTDEGDAFYPWQVFTNDSLRAGSLPLWNPNSFGGLPFLANGTTGLLYPPRLILSLFFSADWVHDLSAMLQFFLSGLAMFAVLKGYRVGFAGALLAGIAWMLNSFTLAWIQLEHISTVTVLLPAAIWCIHRAATRRSWWTAVAAGLMLGLLALGANAEFALIAYIACLAYAGALAARLALPSLRQRRWKVALLALLQPGLIVFIAIGVAAVQLLPTYSLVTGNARAPYPYAAYLQLWLVSPSTYWNTFRHPALPLTAQQMSFEMAFVGLPTALCAIVGFFQRRPGATFARWLALSVFLVSVGTPATWLVYHAIPNFGSIRPLGRALWLWEFAVALLGGIGLDACLRWARTPRITLPRHLPGRALARRLSTVAERNDKVILGAVGATAAFAIVLTTVQLGAYDRQINPPFEPRTAGYLFPATPLVHALERDRATRDAAEPQRLFPIRRLLASGPGTPMLYASDHLVFGLDSAEGYEPLMPERTAALWRVVQGERPDTVLAAKLESAYVPSYYPQTTRFDLLPRLGVTTLLVPPGINKDPTWTPARYAPLRLRPLYSGDDGSVYTIADPPRRAYVVYNAETVATPLEALQRFTDPAFDYQHRVLFERTEHVDAPAALPVAPESAAEPQAIITKHGTNDLALDVTSSQPGWLVIAEMWAPGWHGWVNGRAADVHRADFGLRAVAIPAGVSHVEMSYRPREFVGGLILTTGSVGVILVAATLDIALRTRRRRAARRDRSDALLRASDRV